MGVEDRREVGAEAIARYIIPIGDPSLEKLEFSVGYINEEIGDLESERVEVVGGLTQALGSWQRVLFLKVNNERSIFPDGTSETDLLLIPGVSYASLPPNFLTGWVRDAAYYFELSGSPETLGSDASYLRFIGRADAQRVLDACPDAEWRVIFALSRYGGLRCPSEHLSLRWSDIQWDRDRMRVPSPKTAHHPGGESRLVPLFSELLPHLREAFEQAPPGAEFVITRCRGGGANLRTTLTKIIRRAGLEPWPKLFHNLRSTRAVIDQYRSDNGRYPDSLEQLVEKRYLPELPMDPVLESREGWIVEPPPEGEQGMVGNLRSGAPGNDRKGRPYAEW